MSNNEKVLAYITAVATVLGVIFAGYQACGPTDTERPPSSTSPTTPSRPQGDTTQASTRPPPAAAQEKHGDVTLNEGDQVDFETGQVGRDVPNNDLSRSGGYPPVVLIPSSGAIVGTYSDLTADSCREELESDDADSSASVYSDGEVFCLRTVEGHMAAVAVVNSYPSEDNLTQLKYTVWL